VDPSSVSASGKYAVERIVPSQLADLSKLKQRLLQHPNRVLWIDDRKDSSYSKQERKLRPLLLNTIASLPTNTVPAIIVSSTSKLSWTIYGFVQPIPLFTLSNSFKSDSIKSVEFCIKNKFFADYKTRNVIGLIRGKTRPDSLIVFTAHYDHLGMMGNKAYFPGANDNASGVSMLLSLARYYSDPAHRPDFTMVFIALSAEELGLLGSQYFVEHPLFDLKSVRFLLNIDMAGNGDLGVTVVNGTIYKDKFDRLVKINSDHGYLKQVKIRGEACNSDHCSFYRKGVPCFFIYTMGGVPFYHDVFDRSETLPLSAFTNYFHLISDFVDSL
jgi:aminopeptidase YwaD